MTTTTPQMHCGSNVALYVDFPLMASLDSTTQNLAVGSRPPSKNVVFEANAQLALCRND